MKINLYLGEINLGKDPTVMSGLRWIAQNGQYCKKGDPIAYCNLQLLDINSTKAMHGEMKDFQLVLISPVSGKLKVNAGNSYGGMVDQLPNFIFWKSETLIGEIESPIDSLSQSSMRVEAIFVAGKRYASFAESRSGMLTGWFSKTRVWTADKGEIKTTVLALGICDLINTVRTEKFIPLDLLNLIPTSNQIILIPEGLTIPTASMVIDQLSRNHDQLEELIKNYSEMIQGHRFEADDYLFLGALLTEIKNNYAVEKNTTLTRAGIQYDSCPDIILTSLSAQSRRIFRHKLLGYSIAFHKFRMKEFSPAIHSWLKNNFEQVFRSPEDIGMELKDLSSLLGPEKRLIVLNIPINPFSDPIVEYDIFDNQTFNQLGDVNSREINVVLDKLVRDGLLELVDVNLLSAKLGTRWNMPDGIHWSGLLEREVTNEIGRAICQAINYLS
jgi:hypothetical protein